MTASQRSSTRFLLSEADFHTFHPRNIFLDNATSAPLAPNNLDGKMPPQDASLYGQPRPKKQKKALDLSSSLNFTAQLSSLISTHPSSGPKATGSSSSSSLPAASSSSQRARTDLFSRKPKRRRDDGASNRRDDGGDGGDDDSNKLVLKDHTGTEEEAQQLSRARRKLEEKARLYDAMKRGEHVAAVPKSKFGQGGRPGDGDDAGPLVDFDRKWAEAHPEGRDDDSDSSFEPAGELDHELVEFEDEFGRQRRGTRREAQREAQRRRRREAKGGEVGGSGGGGGGGRGPPAEDEEDDPDSALPAAPRNLIVGDAIQSGAFATADPERMAALARARAEGREETPPSDEHYDASREVRIRGTGFYQFSREEEVRQDEMRSLERERAETERVRAEREGRKEDRRREMERRRKEIGERKARRIADSFLSGLEADIGGGGEEKGTEG